MNKKYSIGFSLLLVAGCSNSSQESTATSVNTEATVNHGEYGFENDGRDHNAPRLHQTFTVDALPAVKQLQDCDMHTAINRQRTYLNKKSSSYSKTVDGLRISKSDMLRTLDAVEVWAQNPSYGLSDLQAYKIAGKENHGNVQFTGYFSPKIYVNSKRTSKYRYPIYAKPRSEGRLPSREEIDFDGALDGQGLELAYSDNLYDSFFMQIQGSGIVEFVDTGEVATFAYHGANGHKYFSIGRQLIDEGHLTPDEVSLESIKQWLINNPNEVRRILSLNPSYVFFHRNQDKPKGANGQPVTAFCSIAVDTNYIPFGSTVIIKRPVLDDRGNLTHHETSVFFAQDRGGAIKGPGRVDIYMGEGERAKKLGSDLKHYGNLWLLLPK